MKKCYTKTINFFRKYFLGKVSSLEFSFQCIIHTAISISTVLESILYVKVTGCSGEFSVF
jgi:hypothetical protein